MPTFGQIFDEVKATRQAFTDKDIWAGLDHGGKAVSLVGQFGGDLFGPKGDGPVLFGGTPLTLEVHEAGLAELQAAFGVLATTKAELALAPEMAAGPLAAFDWQSLLKTVEDVLMTALQAWLKKKIGL